MRKLLFIAVLMAVLQAGVNGQTRDYNFNAGFSTDPIGVTTLTGGRWLILVRGTDGYPDYLHLLIVKPGDTPIVFKPLQFSLGYTILGAHVQGTPDGGFVIALGTQDCDTNGPSIFVKFDAACNQEWIHFYDPVYGIHQIVPYYVHASPDSNLIGIVGNTVYKLNLHTGATIWSKSFYANKPVVTNYFVLLPGTEDMLAVGTPSLQLWHADSTTYNLTRDTSISPVVNNPTGIKKGGDWYYVSDYVSSRILGFKMPDWSTGWTYMPTDDVYNYAPTTDGLMLLEKTASGFKSLKVGLLGQVLGQTPGSDPWIKPSSITHLGDSILIIGTCRSGPTPGSTTDVWFRTMESPASMETAEVFDAAVTDVTQNLGIQIDTVTNPLYAPNLYNFSGGHFKVLVTNKGQQALDSVVVRTYIGGDGLSLCPGQPIKIVHYGNLDLPPGSSKWLDFGDISGYGLQKVPTHLCFWTSAPNNHPDADHSNDVFCIPIYTTHCSNPTIACQSYHTVNISPATGTGQITAVSLLQSAMDNCTTSGQLKFGIRRLGAGTGFPVDTAGNPVTSLTFSCADLGPQSVELWASDLLNHASSCETIVTVIDPSQFCPADSATAIIAGQLLTETYGTLQDGVVAISGNSASIPAFNTHTTTPSTGIYRFNTVPLGLDLSIIPTKDDFPLNGVSTYDLVLISKHLLGIQALNSPYKIIAADANHNGSVTTADIVEIRKLILGIIPKYTHNTSWRFVDAQFMFEHSSSPFQDSFPEMIQVHNLSAGMPDRNFVAIKVGDVNGSAIANAGGGVGDRGSGRLVFDLTPIRANLTPIPSPRGEGGLHSVPVLGSVGFGEVFSVRFRAAERVEGYQFTVNLNDLEVLDVVPGEGMKAENFGVFSDAITTSFEGDVVGEFSVKFRALRSGRLSEMLGVSSRITRAEGYGENGDLLDIAFRFNEGETAAVSHAGFELYQNQPNPAAGNTVIGFYLPEAAVATLNIYDQAGRLVYTRKGDFSKGNQQFTLDGASLGGPGVYGYRVSTQTDSATKSMILIH